MKQLNFFRTMLWLLVLFASHISLAQTTITVPAACDTCSSTLNPILLQAGAAAGTFSGRTCFDVAQSNDNANGCGALSSRTANRADFTQAATHTQTYTFTPPYPVSNVRFYYINDVGSSVIAISGNNTGNNISTAVNATVNFNTNLNTLAAGLTRSNQLSSRIFVVYNNNAVNNNNPNDDRVLSQTVNIRDCDCCGAFIWPTVWKEFLCHNLGADPSLDPNTPDIRLNGAYIQWGKRGPNTTGDSRVDWRTAPTNGASGFAAQPTSVSGDAGTISGWNNPYYTLDQQLWRTFDGTKTANDPCPTGYRVPTFSEWQGVMDYNTRTNSGTWNGGLSNTLAMLSFGPSAGVKTLSLPAAGSRHPNDGNLEARGSMLRYWSSSYYESQNNTVYLFEANSAIYSTTGFLQCNYGIPVRCIKE